MIGAGLKYVPITHALLMFSSAAISVIDKVFDARMSLGSVHSSNCLKIFNNLTVLSYSFNHQGGLVSHLHIETDESKLANT